MLLFTRPMAQIQCRILGLQPNGPFRMVFQAVGDGKPKKRLIDRQAIVKGGVKVCFKPGDAGEVVRVWTLGKPKASFYVQASQLRPIEEKAITHPLYIRF